VIFAKKINTRTVKCIHVEQNFAPLIRKHVKISYYGQNL